MESTSEPTDDEIRRTHAEDDFAAILAVQIVMVFRISSTFGHKESKEQIRGAILSLFGSILPAGIGHSAGLAIASRVPPGSMKWLWECRTPARWLRRSMRRKWRDLLRA